MRHFKASETLNRLEDFQAPENAKKGPFRALKQPNCLSFRPLKTPKRSEHMICVQRLGYSSTVQRYNWAKQIVYAKYLYGKLNVWPLTMLIS